MGFVIIIIGLIVTIAAVRGRHSELADLVKGDFTGPNNFLVWVVAIAVVGGLGYIRPIRPIANAFLVLLIVVLFISNGGFFAQLQRQLRI